MAPRQMLAIALMVAFVADSAHGQVLHAIEASQPSLASHSDIFGQACALALVIVRASRYDLKDMTCAGSQSLPEITLTEGAAYIVFAVLECRSTDVHTT